MDLVLKINDKCNFACDFCSSNMIAADHKDLPLWKVTSYLVDHPQVKNIIVNGGDPLCVDPEWYWNLLYWLDETKRDINISFTTNLWDFYKHPEKWEELFKERISVCTSFQYGGGRKLADGTEFTEDMFKEIFYMFEERIGYKLKFIAVVDGGNSGKCIKTVKLAKELGTTCRINPALKSGRTEHPYPFCLMMMDWLCIIGRGYGEYEENCKLLKDVWAGNDTECPFNSRCHDSEYGIRCMSPNGAVHTCPAIADDIMKGIDEAYVDGSNKKIPFEDIIIKAECATCRNFKLCNSCKKRIMDIKSGGELHVTQHCNTMKSLIERMDKLLCQ